MRGQVWSPHHLPRLRYPVPGPIHWCIPRVRSFLLRLLLCTTLLLNGMGASVASAHIALMDLQQAAATAAMMEGGEDCPHAAAMADTMHGAHAEHAGKAEGDCLERCLDLCLQHCHAVLAAVQFPPPAPAPGLLPLRAHAPPASAAQYPPLRPPIST